MYKVEKIFFSGEKMSNVWNLLFFVTYLTDYCAILHNIFQLKSDFEEKMCIFAKSNSCVPWKNTIRKKGFDRGR